MMAVTSIASAQILYEESNGIVIMEAENTASPLGLWIKDDSHPNFTGSGYLSFDGNEFTHGPAISPLEYTFRIHQTGLYFLQIRCAETNQTINGEHRDDVSNDCYVRVDGDYTASPEAGNNHTDDAPLTLLQTDTKFFGGKNDGSFVWAGGFQNNFQGNLDPGGHQNKRVAIYNFKAGETYTLVVHGRSKAFKIDRFAFSLASRPDSSARSTSLVETNAEHKWRVQHFDTSDNSGIAASTFDANGDGESNFLEFATGQDPHANTLASQSLTINGNAIEYRYTRLAGANSDGVAFTVNESTTLESDTWTSAGISQSVESQSEEIQTVLATIPIDDSDQKFVQLKISN